MKIYTSLLGCLRELPPLKASEKRERRERRRLCSLEAHMLSFPLSISVICIPLRCSRLHFSYYSVLGGSSVCISSSVVSERSVIRESNKACEKKNNRIIYKKEESGK